MLMMDKAKKIALHSDSSGTRVGCILVGQYGEVVGEGFNVNLLSSSSLNVSGDLYNMRRMYLHAEMMAILSMRGSAVKAYCTLAPCFECLKHLYFVGVTDIVYDKCLGSNKIFTYENFELYSFFISHSGVNLHNSANVSFLDEIIDKGCLCER